MLGRNWEIDPQKNNIPVPAGVWLIRKMAVGGFVVQGGRDNYNGGMTAFVVVTCLVAATGGLIFGYDIGISG